MPSAAPTVYWALGMGQGGVESFWPSSFWRSARLSKVSWNLGPLHPSASHRSLGQESLRFRAIKRLSERVNMCSAEEVFMSSCNGVAVTGKGSLESQWQGEPYHTLGCTNSTAWQRAELVSSPVLAPLPEAPKGSVGHGSQFVPGVSSTTCGPFQPSLFLSSRKHAGPLALTAPFILWTRVTQ